MSHSGQNQKSIASFLIKLDKTECRLDLLIWPLGGGNSPQKVQMGPSQSFILGYMYEGIKGSDGEFINIQAGKNEVIVKNDLYGAYPLYLYENTKQAVLSPSIREIQKNLPAPLSINSELIYVYFAYGYIPVLGDTLYKNIRLVPPDSTIQIDQSVKIMTRLYRLMIDEHSHYDESLLVHYLCESIRRKIDNAKKKQSFFCLTSGNDSLLGLLGINANKEEMDTATWGYKNSTDVIQARNRHRDLSPNTTHFEFLIDTIKPKPQDLEDYSGMVGGISTLSSVYLSFFTRHMAASGKSIHFYCDHYEATRRLLHSLKEIEEKYTTPPGVVKKFFCHQERYRSDLTSVLQMIPTYYKNDPLMEYYFYDRYIKGPFYKNLVISQLGAVKITLPMDFCFLNLNHTHVRKINDHSYTFLLNSLLLRNDRGKERLNKENRDSQKQLPFFPTQIIEWNRDYLVSILDSSSSSDFSDFWDIGEIRRALLGESYTDKQEWFLLRLMSLLIFKEKYRMSLK